MSQQCPFCAIAPERIFYESEEVFGIWDAYPISEGHALLVPRRHVRTWFDATDQEQQALIASIREARRLIEKSNSPSGYNIGINSGEAAGQTVPHLHIHVVPRYEGDVEDPRGGVRWVVPDKARYWDD